LWYNDVICRHKSLPDTELETIPSSSCLGSTVILIWIWTAS